MTVQYIFRLEDPSFDDSSSLPKQKQQEIWRVKEIKRIVDCSLPQAKAIHDAIAAGEFHKVDGVALAGFPGPITQRLHAAYWAMHDEAGYRDPVDYSA